VKQCPECGCFSHSGQTSKDERKGKMEENKQQYLLIDWDEREAVLIDSLEQALERVLEDDDCDVEDLEDRIEVYAVTGAEDITDKLEIIRPKPMIRLKKTDNSRATRRTSKG
jgi:hypothetical protein